MSRRPRGPGCLHFGRGLRHALAFAVTLHRRCVVNQENPARVASQLGLDCDQTRGVARLLRRVRFIPSVERMAVIAMRDPGFNDEDIGEMFGKTEEWSAEVRGRQADIRRAEAIPMELEFLTELDFRDGGYDDRLAEAREMHSERTYSPRFGRPCEIKAYHWNSKNGTFVSTVAD